MTNREAYERDCNELEQYREIGTVEQVRNQKHNLEMAYKKLSLMVWKERLSGG